MAIPQSIKKIIWSAIFLLLLFCPLIYSQTIPSPEQILGFEIGADYKLADYHQILNYFHILSKASDRILLQYLGLTTENNNLFLTIISSPKNLQNLNHYKTIQARLADPRKINDKIADSLVVEGKTIISINCSIHSIEIGASLMSMQLAFELANKNDPETIEILENTIILLLPVQNPDGLDIVTNWYNKYLNTRFEGCRLPYLYHKYTGHDINRDWYMLSQRETSLTVSKIYNVWHPQIVLDMHQMGPNAPRLFLPPYIDPVDPNIDPIIVSKSAMLGQAIASDLIAQGKKGIITNYRFDAWSPARAYIHYHGGVRILSETASCNIASPVKTNIFKYKNNISTSTWNYVLPWTDGEWHIKDIVEYDKAVAWSLLVHASKYSKRWLQNFYQINKNALIQKPYAYLIPKNQWDHSMVLELLQLLHKGQVEIHQAEVDFYFSGIKYEKGSFIVLMNQPYSSYIKTLLSTYKYPPKLIKSAYDKTGHNIAHLMGVKVLPVEYSLNIKLSRLKQFELSQEIEFSIPQNQYIAFSTKSNYAFKAINQLQDERYKVYRLTDTLQMQNTEFEPGAIFFKTKISNDFLTGLNEKHNLQIETIPEHIFPIEASKLHKNRIGLYKSWVADAAMGWTRFVLEEYGFSYKLLTDLQIKKNQLKKLDILILPDLIDKKILKGNTSGQLPAEFCGGLGIDGRNNLKEFVSNGGTLIAINQAVPFVINSFQLPVQTIIDENIQIPGPILKIKVDNTHPICFGMPEESAIVFYNSPIIKDKSQNKIAWFPTNKLLLSGAIANENILYFKKLIFEFDYNEGKIILLAFNPVFRAQTRAVYKILFNSILNANAKSIKMKR